MKRELLTLSTLFLTGRNLPESCLVGASVCFWLCFRAASLAGKGNRAAGFTGTLHMHSVWCSQCAGSESVHVQIFLVNTKPAQGPLAKKQQLPPGVVLSGKASFNMTPVLDRSLCSACFPCIDLGTEQFLGSDFPLISRLWRCLNKVPRF